MVKKDRLKQKLINVIKAHKALEGQVVPPEFMEKMMKPLYVSMDEYFSTQQKDVLEIDIYRRAKDRVHRLQLFGVPFDCDEKARMAVELSDEQICLLANKLREYCLAKRSLKKMYLKDCLKISQHRRKVGRPNVI